MSVKCSATFRPEGDQQLTADSALSDFIRDLPASAELSSVTVDKGNQRDPWPVLVGLRATWEEDR